MLSVPLKLEAALATYIAANYGTSGNEFNGVTISHGHTSADVTAARRLDIYAGAPGGAHLRQGNYEVPVRFVLTTKAQLDVSETSAAVRLLHGERMEALLGIFAEGRVATVAAALAAIDAELGVSSFWRESTADEFDEDSYTGELVLVFEAYIVA